jgi:hypothetical protein
LSHYSCSSWLFEKVKFRVAVPMGTHAGRWLLFAKKSTAKPLGFIGIAVVLIY